jgi:hypothetical protein
MECSRVKRRTVLASAIGGLLVALGRRPAHAQYDYERAIYDACSRYGCDPAQVIRVMYCESSGDPGAVGAQGERGLFQFHPQGEWPHGAWYGPYEQIELAASLFAAGRADAWVCK